MALTDPNDDGSGFFNWQYTGMPPLEDANAGAPVGPLAGGMTNPVGGPMPPPQAAPTSYQPMAGWDAGKLNGGADSLKYQFGRWLQSSPFYNGGSGSSARGNMTALANGWNSFSGGNAKASGDDGIDFGNGWNKVDLINGNGDGWQWGAYNDPNAQGTSSGTNSLSGLMGLSGGQYAQAQTAPTWTAMQANSSAYGQSPLATAQRRSPSTLAQLLGGQ